MAAPGDADGGGAAENEDEHKDEPQTRKEFNEWRTQFKNTVHLCAELYDDRKRVYSFSFNPIFSRP